MARARHSRDTWRYKAPKAEFYLLDEHGRRPVYYWGQAPEFYQAGQPMPPMLVTIAEQLNAEYGLTGVDRLNSCLIICNDDPSVHEAPPHSDKHRSGRFFDISLGYLLSMVFSDAAGAEVARQDLEPNSLLAVSAADNARYKHAVPPDPAQPREDPRFSVVFRAITAHPEGLAQGEHFAEVDETAAARVRPGGDLWRTYVPHMNRPEAVAAAAAGPAAETGADALFDAITADMNANPSPPLSGRARARASRAETVLLLDDVLAAIHEAPSNEPFDCVRLESLSGDAMARAVEAKAKRVLGVEELPPDATFTSGAAAIAALDVSTTRRPLVCSVLSKLARATAHRLLQPPLPDQPPSHCVEFEASWREGERRRHSTFVVWTGGALAARQQLATEFDGSNVSDLRVCEGCGQLSITLCGCAHVAVEGG